MHYTFSLVVFFGKEREKMKFLFFEKKNKIKNKNK